MKLKFYQIEYNKYYYFNGKEDMDSMVKPLGDHIGLTEKMVLNNIRQNLLKLIYLNVINIVLNQDSIWNVLHVIKQ